MPLPAFDKIDSLHCKTGTYSLDRWPLNAMEQIAFLQEIVQKYGPDACVSLVGPYDGYPGYIEVSLSAVRNQTGFAETAGPRTVIKG